MKFLFPSTDIFTGEVSCKYKSIYGYDKGCRCKDCRKLKNKEIQKRKYIVREIYDQIRNSHCCFDCGRTDISKILNFHHLTNNENDRNPRNCNGLVHMIRELRKGIFLCPTCHTLRHVDPVTGLVRMDISDFR